MMNEQYKTLLSNLSKFDANEISDSMSFSDDFKFDSLKMIELLTEVEDTFNMRFKPDEDNIGAIFETVGSLWKHIATIKGKL